MPLFSPPPPYNQPPVASELQEMLDEITSLCQMVKAREEQVELTEKLQVLESRLVNLKFKPKGDVNSKVLAFPLSLRMELESLEILLLLHGDRAHLEA